LIGDVLVHLEAQDVAVKTYAAFYIAYDKVGCEPKKRAHSSLPGAQAEAKHTLQCARFSSFRDPARSSAQVESGDGFARSPHTIPLGTNPSNREDGILR